VRGAVLSFCPKWPTAGGTGVVAAEYVELALESVLGPLAAPGRNTWSALVSPASLKLASDESQIFEVRALEPIPHRVTLRARHDARNQTVVLHGRVTAAGKPEPGARVLIVMTRKSWPKVRQTCCATTDAAGWYSLRRRVTATTRYFPSVEVPPRPCTQPSRAPAGCILETVSSPPLGRVVEVTVRSRR
jgi:hypothetical protein